MNETSIKQVTNFNKSPILLELALIVELNPEGQYVPEYFKPCTVVDALCAPTILTKESERRIANIICVACEIDFFIDTTLLR
jgi:hypothetical protein